MPHCNYHRKSLGKFTVFHRLLVFLIPAVLAACSTTKVPPRDPSKPISVSIAPYTVAILDQFEIRFPDGHKETFSVGQDGVLALPGGMIPAAGLHSEVVEKRVRAAVPGAASVKTIEFRTNSVTVLGEVFHQIHTDLGDGPMRVMDAIASANGFTPLANQRRVKLLRENAGRTEVYEFDLREMLMGRQLTQNFLLQPGDVITVPRNFL
jgi:polysaccharide export outer membrane protein